MMSTPRNCLIVEIEPSMWYLVLEDESAPKNAFDWLDHARAFGPFKTVESSVRYLFNNFSNPGGYQTLDYANRGL